MLLLAILSGKGLDTGWTFYTPYSIETQTGVIFATFGAFVLGFSSIFTGLNFLVTVNTMRAKGQGWFKLPLFLWSLYAHINHSDSGHAGSRYHVVDVDG